MIDSQFPELGGDTPDQDLILHFHELTLEEAILPLNFIPDEVEHAQRLFFLESEESQFEREQQQLEEGNTQGVTQAVGRPKRVTNTIFKTSLSQYRKSIIDVIKARPYLSWLRQQLYEVYGVKNMGVFPKLNFMVRQLELQSQISIHWSSRSMKLLTKKADLVRNQKYGPERLQKLEETISSMNQCIHEQDFDQAFERYWGKYRQQNKHEKCKEEVDRFCKEFRKIAQQHRLHARAETRGTSERLRRRNGSETRETNQC